MAVETMYPLNPWSGLSTNKREWYDPMLIDFYERQRIYNGFVSTVFDMGGNPATPEMHVSNLIPPHVNFEPIGMRQIWLPTSMYDTYERTIRFSHYGGKMSMHAFDDMITYWRTKNGPGLQPLLARGLGYMMLETMETVARNAFFTGSLVNNGYHAIGGNMDQLDGTHGFNSLDAQDKLSTEILGDLHLGMTEREVPYTHGLNPGVGTIFCVTTPGVIHDLRNESSGGDTAAKNEFIDAHRYSNNRDILLRYGEIGSYMNVRFIRSMRALLRNVGPIITQAKVTTPVNVGDGSPGAGFLVDGVENVGQPDAVHFLVVDTVDGFEVGDWLSIHALRTSDFGVQNGVDFRDGKCQERRVVKIDAEAKTIAFDKPIMEAFLTDLEAPTGTYAYVTKGRNVHTAGFFGGNDGVVQGILHPPRIKNPRPIDDLEEMMRMSWHSRFGMVPFEPKVNEFWFGSASNRFKGKRYE